MCIEGALLMAEGVTVPLMWIDLFTFNSLFFPFTHLYAPVV